MDLLDRSTPSGFRPKRRQEFLARQILTLADRQGMSIATAECGTGGRVATILANVDGLPDRFDCGLVPHSDRAKTELLGVPAALIDLDGAVSAPVTKLMAKGALGRCQSGIALAISARTEPSASGHAAEAHIATIDRDGIQRHQHYRCSDSGRNLRDHWVMAALTLLHDHLLSLTVDNDAPSDPQPVMFARLAV